MTQKNKKSIKSSVQEEYLAAIGNFIKESLKQLPHTAEDEERIDKIVAFYGRKRNITAGRAQNIAAAIIWLYARINFLGEKEGKKWTQESVAGICGVSKSVIGQKAGELMKALKIDLLDQRFARREMAAQNPLMKMRVDPQSGLLFMEDDNKVDSGGVPMVRDHHDYYYDAMDFLSSGDADGAIKLLRKALEIEEHSVEAYVGMACAYREKGNQEKWREYADKSFEETKKKFPAWPKELRWGYLENREYLRAIEQKAAVSWETGNLAEAEKLYKLLLKLNPGDNQGIRYLLAGMFAGITGDKVDEMFDEGNEKQDWSKIETLLAEQDAKHHFWREPEEE